MNMHLIDWVIVAAILLGTLLIARITSRFNRSVADFLVANRSAGRYMLAMAGGMAGTGAISIAASFEKFYEAGFAGAWWVKMMAPLGLVMALTGFVTYRYRETRALTMAQFFEMRYSRNFRIFSGTLAWTSGLFNYGIFPGVTSRFLIHLTGMPETMAMGAWTLPTMVPVMLVMLGLALFLTLSGGQISVMVSDFFQGQMVNIVMLILLVVLFRQINWSDLITGLQMAPAGQSKINPFKQKDVADFNVSYFLIAAFIQVYAHKAWQGSSAYNAAAKSPHEARMAAILGEFRGLITYLLILLLPISMYAMMHLPRFAAQQHIVHAALAQISNPQLQKQMLVPTALATILPTGIMGLFVSVIIAAALATDGTSLHSWGSIFIQDVLMPFRQRPLAPTRHMLVLRISIIFVAAFGFTFSLLFPLHEYILMYMQITGAIFLGGAGSAILGGLYWKRGTVEGAWAGMIVGSLLAVSGIIVQNIIWPSCLPGWKKSFPDLNFLHALPEKFPLNGIQMALVAALCSILSYVIFSLLSRRPPTNMEKLLHRGPYAVETAGHHPQQVESAFGPVPANISKIHGRKKFWRILGVNQDFTKTDKAIYLANILWTLFFFVIFVVGTTAGLVYKIPDAWWIKWWETFVGVTVFVGVGSVIWFLIGGFYDLTDLVRTFRAERIDEKDDGRVSAAERKRGDD